MTLTCRIRKPVKRCRAERTDRHSHQHSGAPSAFSSQHDGRQIRFSLATSFLCLRASSVFWPLEH